MAIATLKVNPASTAYDVDLPDGSEAGGSYEPGAADLVVTESGKAFYITFDAFEDLKPNTVYELVEVETLVIRDAADVEEADDEEEEEDGDEDDGELEEG